MYFGVELNFLYPLTTLLTESKKSFSETDFRRARMAYIPASVPDRPEFGTGSVWAQTTNELETNVSIAIHTFGMNFKNVPAALQVWQTEFHLAVQATRTQQGWIECIWTICRHQYLNIPAGIEPVEFCDNLKHGTLHLIVRAIFVGSGSGTSNRINFIEKYNTRSLGPGHSKEFADHPCTFANVLLD
jgi:hypothetical protein